jgi:hypothetical protein
MQVCPKKNAVAKGGKSPEPKLLTKAKTAHERGGWLWKGRQRSNVLVPVDRVIGCRPIKMG